MAHEHLVSRIEKVEHDMGVLQLARCKLKDIDAKKELDPSITKLNQQYEALTEKYQQVTGQTYVPESQPNPQQGD